jgi:tRNA (guanosine-2'-O-)-methyltransferase
MRELRSRSAASATKWLKLVRHQSISKAVGSLHRKKVSVLVAALGEDGKPQWEHRLTGKIAIAVGNEHLGASKNLLRLADGMITIPMRGMVQSLNVSVATAVILEEALRQRLTSPKQKRTR